MHWIAQISLWLSLIFTGSTVVVTSVPPNAPISHVTPIVASISAPEVAKPTQEPTKPQTPSNTTPEVNPNASFMEVHAPTTVLSVVVKAAAPTETVTATTSEEIQRLPENCLYGAYISGGVQVCRLK